MYERKDPHHVFPTIAQGLRFRLKDVCSSYGQIFQFLHMLRGTFYDPTGTPFFFQYGTMNKNNLNWIRSMAWKLLLPIELAKPLLSAASFRSREEFEQRNTGPQYLLVIKALENVPPEKKPKRAELVLCPYIWTNSGLFKTGIDAAAPLDVIVDAPEQPKWWYKRFHEPFT